MASDANSTNSSQWDTTYTSQSNDSTTTSVSNNNSQDSLNSVENNYFEGNNQISDDGAYNCYSNIYPRPTATGSNVTIEELDQR